MTNIGQFAFLDCSLLKSITIGDGVTGIGYSVFYNCGSLEKVAIGIGVTSVEMYAFYDCDSLTTVYYGGNASDWAEISISSSGNSDLTSATIYYYSATQPTAAGNYWHYAEDGVTPVVW